MKVREIMAIRVTPAQMIVTVATFAVAVKLAGDRNMLAAWSVVLLGVVLLVVLWLVPRLLRPARTLRLEESTVLAHSCAVVWALVEPAEFAPLLNPNLRVGYRVPGTPSGVGERQALEHHDGTTSILEVIEHEPERLAVTRMVQPRLPEPHRIVHALEPTGTGSRYTLALELPVNAGARIPPTLERSWRDVTRTQFERARSILDSGEPIVAPTRDTSPAATDRD